MDSFLYWYSQNNKIIIQSLSACIGLVLIYFIYRIFFSPAEASSEASAQATSRQLADLDKKITKIMGHQVKENQPEVFTGDAAEYEANTKVSAEAEGQAIISQIQNELEHLKKELHSSNEIISAKNAELITVKEKLIEYQKTIAVEPGPGSTSGDPALVAKIDELQKKLQEYDIISDDISELQSLRAENAELKSKVEEKTSAG